MKGEYQENTAHTGDYTREEQEYYPIKGSPVDDSKEKYRENIQNFYFSESDENSRGAYDLNFETVTNETVNKNLKAGLATHFRRNMIRIEDFLVFMKMYMKILRL